MAFVCGAEAPGSRTTVSAQPAPVCARPRKGAKQTSEAANGSELYSFLHRARIVLRNVKIEFSHTCGAGLLPVFFVPDAHCVTITL